MKLTPTAALGFVALASAVACGKSPATNDAPPATTTASASGATSAGAAGAADPSASGASAPSPDRDRVPTAPATPLNVLLITIDSLRQDMPWAGYPRDIAPNLTKLAKESVVYTHAYSISSYTAKSVAAFSTSRYPSSLYRSGFFFTDYSKANTFLAEVLHDHGIRTMGVHSHLYFAHGKQLDQGFDVWQVVPGITFDPETDKNITSDKMTDIGVKLLGDPANTGKQFFAWLHYTDPHDQYITHPESPDFGKKNRDRYDSEVFFTDLHVGRLLDFAKKQPWWSNTAVIVSADHGEAFGEHGVYKHAFWLWDVLTRVPLFVHLPGGTPRTIDALRSHIDLAPTVLDLMGVKDAPPSFVGRSLGPELRGGAPDDREPVVLDLPLDSQNPQIRAIVKGGKKLIVYGKSRSELYDIVGDPGELHDLAGTDAADLATMKAEFDRVWSTIPFVESYGGMKLHDGSTANGPMKP